MVGGVKCCLLSATLLFLACIGIGLMFDTHNKRRDPFAVTVATSFLVLGPLLCLCICWHVMVLVTRAMFREFKQGKWVYWGLLSCHITFVAWMIALTALSVQFWSEFSKNTVHSSFSLGCGAICFAFQYILAVLCTLEMLIDCLEHHKKYC